jgi:hypothetical protein
MATKKEISEAAAALGRRGGKVKSPAKTKAVRANALLGGRPLKEVPFRCSRCNRPAHGVPPKCLRHPAAPVVSAPASAVLTSCPACGKRLAKPGIRSSSPEEWEYVHAGGGTCPVK